MKKFFSLFEDNTHYAYNKPKMSAWAYPIVLLDMFLVIFLSAIGVVTLFLSPINGIITILADIFIIYLLIQVTNGRKNALQINTVVALLYATFITMMIMIAMTHITS